MLFKSTLKQIYEVVPEYFSVGLLVAKELNPDYVVYPYTIKLNCGIALTVYLSRDLNTHACITSPDRTKSVATSTYAKILPRSFDVKKLGEKINDV